MKLHIREETVLRYFGDFFQSYPDRGILLDLITSGDPRASIDIEYFDLETFDTDLAEYVVQHPLLCLKLAQEALKDFLPTLEDRVVNIGLCHLPSSTYESVEDIGVRQKGRMISIETIVRRTEVVRSRCRIARFMCGRCGSLNEIQQHRKARYLREPVECEGCKKSVNQTIFEHLEDFDADTDSQVIHVSDIPEYMMYGTVPRVVPVTLEGNLVDTVQPGNRCTITGIVLKEDRGRGKRISAVQDYYIRAVHVKKHENDYRDLDIDDEDEAQIQEWSQDPLVFEKFSAAIAPTVSGYDGIKEALVLQQFGGVRRELPDGTFLRGDIHILLIGDPGTAKSKFLSIVSKVAPRGSRASGQATTKAGLTAAAVQENEGRWTFEAGAMPLADGGMLCVDELEKMCSEDRSSMHDGLEQQEITLNKAGMNVTLPTRCSLLAAANPKYGRFDTSEPVVDQLELPPTLLTRFDLIYPIIDTPDMEQDSMIADTILDNFSGLFDPLEVKVGFLRKYIAHARSTCLPVITPDARRMIRETYLKQRRASTKAIQITPRQLEALVRLATASAKVRLSDTIEEEDAKRAVRVYGHSIVKLCFDDGIVDIDRLEVKSVRRPMLLTFRTYLRRHAPVAEEEIVEAMGKKQFERTSVEYVIRLLKENGEIYENMDGLIGIV